MIPSRASCELSQARAWLALIRCESGRTAPLVAVSVTVSRSGTLPAILSAHDHPRHHRGQGKRAPHPAADARGQPPREEPLRAAILSMVRETNKRSANPREFEEMIPLSWRCRARTTFWSRRSGHASLFESCNKVCRRSLISASPRWLLQTSLPPASAGGFFFVALNSRVGNAVFLFSGLCEDRPTGLTLWGRSRSKSRRAAPQMVKTWP